LGVDEPNDPHGSGREESSRPLRYTLNGEGFTPRPSRCTHLNGREEFSRPLWKVRLALGDFLTAPLRYAPYFRFDVRGNLLDGLYGNDFFSFYLFKSGNYSLTLLLYLTIL
jgi:hypothetical protein